VSTATRAPVCGASIWRSRYSGLNRSKSLICSSDRLSLRSTVAFSSPTADHAWSMTMALPDPAHAAGGDLNAAQHQLLGDPHRAVAGVGQGMIEDRRLDLRRHPV
jgi:hypothetical protein